MEKPKQYRYIILIAILILVSGIYYLIYSARQANNIVLQIECPDAAANFFKQKGYDKLLNAQYSYHWNENLGKCFMLFFSDRQIDGEHTRDHVLMDVLENNNYGFYESYLHFPFTSSKTLANTPDIKKETCEMSPSGIKSGSGEICGPESEFFNDGKPCATYSGKKETCGSESEFLDYIKSYMSN